ncbi:hypothetical protein SY83_08555 [Paenibacillus swuensis]|uniref:Uncharacterized protein n=1 Tax=Paenibacillus swuensis TaxID=1178515 RepID=A0A172TH28_9BACL|nr:hypothetical protein [Paenibacillus swuensis]ANE46320.1 hypothetical protein SY83_08555 [Paenibacillus swuensis]
MTEMKETSLTYCEWDEALSRVAGIWLKLPVTREQLCIRKLVNATVLRNKAGEHTSHETDGAGESMIYVKPWTPASLPVYGEAVREALYEYSDIAEYGEVEYYRYRGERFERFLQQGMGEPYETVTILVDHYRNVQQTDYEIVYTILDTDRNKLLLFMTEA